MHNWKSDWRSENWNPDTCGCKIELNREDTEVVGEDEVDVAAFASPELMRKRKGRRVPNTERTGFVAKVPRLRTQKRNAKGEVVSEVIHGPTEDAPMPGVRLRGRVAEPCQDHVGFSDMVQTQRWKPLTCACVFQQIISGGVLFGACVEAVCDAHQHVSLKDLYDTVLAENRARNEEASEGTA